MAKFFERIIKHKKKILVVFVILFIVSFFCKQRISVNYDMTSYLPTDADSSVALEVMEEEFEGGIPNARVMVKGVDIPEALSYKEKIEAVEGVTSVTWLDDAIDIKEPLEVQDEETVEKYYKDGAALFSVTIKEEARIDAVAKIREIIGEENCMTGSAVSTVVATNSTVSEVGKISVIAVIVVFIVLILTTTSWFEPIVVLVGLGMAVILNAGSNLIFGEISFVTNAAGNILQMAVSLDYMVFLIHRFDECRKIEPNPNIAMKDALMKSMSSIFSSGLTTVIGFLALCFMRFKIGPDLGLALAKGIVISLIVVFVFMPGFIILTYNLMDKTHHRPLLPSCGKFGKLIGKITIPIVICFALMIVPSYLASINNSFYYGSSHIFNEGTQLGDDTAEIKNIFGKSDTYVLLVPKGYTAKETSMLKEIKDLDGVASVIAFVEQAGAEVPYEYLDEETLSKLESDNYSRMVLSVDAEYEGNETYTLIDNVRKIAANYYPDEFYLAGEGVNTYDLKTTVESDMVKVNIVSIGAVFLVLLIMTRSITLPIILVLTIETAIWINLSIPYYSGNSIFYIAYLIISSIQLGATVDYAILMTDRYKENRMEMPKKEAACKTVTDVTISILTSGIVMSSVGFLLGKMSSHGLLSQLGYFLGKGTLCSLVAVLFVLPGLLMLFDKTFIKTDKDSKNKKTKGKITMRNINKVMALALTGILTFSAVSVSSVYAADDNTDKEEVIYGMMDANGNVNGIYAVNIYTGKSSIVDYGEYESVKNLTTTDKINYKDGVVNIETDSEKLYYQGNLETTDLPWKININYYMDGKEYSPENIAGMSGQLKININISQNKKCDESFWKGYALQAKLTLNSNMAENVEAEGATIANVGSDKQLSYIILPGNEKNIEITADVTDFEMDAIEINGIKLNLSVDYDDSELMDKVNEIKNAAKDLDSGTEKLESATGSMYDGTKTLSAGADSLYSGMSNLNSGISEINSGLIKLNEQSSSLTNGSSSVLAALTTIQDSLLGVSMSSENLSNLSAASTSIQSGIDNLVSALKTMDGSIDQYYATLSSSGISDISSFAGRNAAVAESLSSINTNGQYDQVIALLRADAGYINGSNSLIQGIKSNLDKDNGALMIGAVALQTNYAAFNDNIQSMVNSLSTLSSNIASLKQGIDTLVENYSKLNNGVNDYTEAVAKIVAGYEKIYSGSNSLVIATGELNNGTKDLVNGALELYNGTKEMKDGTSEFEDKTKDIDTQISDEISKKINEITGSDVETISFVSKSNTNIESVLFVMKTAAIEKEEVAETVETKSKPKGIVKKFLALFSIYI